MAFNGNRSELFRRYRNHAEPEPKPLAAVNSAAS